MFHSAVLKLTVFYVLIVMAISICFSVVLFQISNGELNRGLTRQGRIFQQLAPPSQIDDSPFSSLDKTRQEQLAESTQHLQLNLFYFNLLILLLSSGLSYWLARKTLQPIEEMIEAQNRFTADASHELRTPITALKTEIEVGLRDGNLSLEEAKKLLNSNLEEIDKLESLSTNLLKLARFDGQNHLELAELSLKEIIHEAYKKIEKLAIKKQIDFEFNLEDLTVKADATRIKELFVTLMDNAIKYSPEATMVKASAIKSGHHAIIKISDHGAGIKASDMPHIFDRFYRADQSRAKNKADGYGLGLSIAKQIVENHHGTITAESKPDHGTTFTITLPI